MSIMGSRIYQKRKEYGYTMEELGAKLGVNKTAVNKWEKGVVKNIKQSTIKKMADIFECSPSWLMGFDSEIEIDNHSSDILSKETIEKIEALDQNQLDLLLSVIDKMYETNRK